MQEDTLHAPNLTPPLRNTSAPRDNEPDDLAKLRKWQEQRIERKMRGEYESAVLHLSELVSPKPHCGKKKPQPRINGITDKQQP